jgi:TfoX/Sxy family transcriptional regulator of competence genes
MAWKKSPPELIAAFEKAKPADPNVESRQMFGYPALFVNGNMIAGTFQDKITVRFGENRTLAGTKTAKPFEPMPGRPMTGFFVVPDPVVKSPAQLRAWVAHAYSYAKTLPPKAAKTKKAPAKKAR